MFDVPSMTHRPLPSNFARTGLPSGSGCGTSVIWDVSQVGAEQPGALASSARRTRTCMTIGVAVFGNRNVSFALVVSPPSVTGVPLTCDHSNFAAPTEVEASSVSGRFCRTVAPTGAMTASVGLLALTVTSTESVRVWPLPVTVSVNDSLPADVGAVNVGVAVVPPVSVTPAGALQDMLSMSPAEPPPSSVTFAPCSTVWSTPASAASGRGARPAPSITTGTVTEPPLDDLTVTWSGGASVLMSADPPLPRALLNPSIVSDVGASWPSLEVAWTCRTSLLPPAVVW